MDNDSSPNNPYAPPKADVADIPASDELTDIAELMSDQRNHRLGRRWLATAVDIVFLIGVYLIVQLFGQWLSKDVVGLICLALLMAYYFAIEAKFGTTVGKYLCGIRVVDRAGRPPGYLRNLVRTFTRLLELNPGLLGGVIAGIVCLITQRSQRLGDIMTGTYVVPIDLLIQYQINPHGGRMPPSKDTP